MKQTEEKLKKALKELNRKDQLIADLKQKLELLHHVDKEDDKKKTTDEKYKSLRYLKLELFCNTNSADYARKDQLAKELKARLESAQQEVKALGEERERFSDLSKKIKLQLDRKEALLNSTKERLEHTMRELEGYKLSSGFTTDTRARKLQKDMADLHLELRDSLQLINELKTTIFQVGQSVIEQITNIPSNEQKKATSTGPSIDSNYIPTDIMSAEELNEILGSTNTNKPKPSYPKKRALQSAENYMHELELL
jgi:DNA repair exonuclease SbcCD ATPase subunit